MEHSCSLVRKGSTDSLGRHEMRYLRPCPVTGAKGAERISQGPSLEVPTV